MSITYACFLLGDANGPVNAPKAINQAILQSSLAAPDSALSVLLQFLLRHASRISCFVTEGCIRKLCAAVKQVFFFRGETPCVAVQLSIPATINLILCIVFINMREQLLNQSVGLSRGKRHICAAEDWPSTSVLKLNTMSNAASHLPVASQL